MAYKSYTINIRMICTIMCFVSSSYHVHTEIHAVVFRASSTFGHIYTEMILIRQGDNEVQKRDSEWEVPNFSQTTMKGRINTTYVVSHEKYYKHRAILIPQPVWNMTGEYTCNVQTFESSDKKSAFMQIIGESALFTFFFSQSPYNHGTRCSSSIFWISGCNLFSLPTKNMS